MHAAVTPPRVNHLTFPPSPVVRRPVAQEIAEGIRLSVMAGRTITPLDVARVLSSAGVRYVLAGAHAVNAHTGRPRATVDVDVLTDAPAKACRALAAAFPGLTVHDTPVMTRFMDGEVEAIDVMKARPAPLFRRVMRLAMDVEIEGQTVRVPSAEGVLAMKFASMVSPGRKRADRLQDAADFARVIEAAGKLDEQVIRDLGEALYDGGGTAAMEMVEAVRTGRPLEI